MSPEPSKDAALAPLNERDVNIICGVVVGSLLDSPTKTRLCDGLRAALAVRVSPPPQEEDIQSRCAVCGWPLESFPENGCVVGNCSMRPLPRRFYSPERAAREYGEDLTRFDPRAKLTTESVRARAPETSEPKP